MSTTLNMSGGNLLTANINGTKVPPSEDRYAALKDLDFLMKQTQQKEETTKILTSTWNANNFNSKNIYKLYTKEKKCTQCFVFQQQILYGMQIIKQHM